MNTLACTLAVLASIATCSLAGSGIWTDLQGDALIRRTDLGNDAPLPIGFTPIDLLSVSTQGWSPINPAIDPYIGSINAGDADILRIEVVLDGLISPPGPIGLNGFAYDPARFGPRPLTGFIELDIDHQKDSGGELMPLARNRYLANVARFGNSPSGSIAERMIQSGSDLDSNFYSSPQFERTGAEFSLVLCGCFSPTIVSQDGNMDSLFNAGESWVVSGRFFERFQSFQPLGATFGGSDFGLFDPVVNLRFVHSTITDKTTITLIFPITNTGAGMLAGEPKQPIDLSLLNHTSLEEAIDDLIIGADFATGPLASLTDDWRDKDFDEFNNPSDWKATALIGTAPTTPQPSSFYIWTDTGFNEHYADLDLNEIHDANDAEVIEEYIHDEDGSSHDNDGTVNGSIGIESFGLEFHFFDLNYDGVISPEDIPLTDCFADITGEGLLNLQDLFAYLDLFNAQDPIADLTGQGLFNLQDIFAYLALYNAGCP